jgi:hypothetical protein
MASTLARFECSGFISVGTRVYSSCWQRRGISPPHCGCLSDYPQLARMWRSRMRRVEARIESHWDHFQCLIQTYSFSCNSQIKCFLTYVHMDIFFLSATSVTPWTASNKRGRSWLVSSYRFEMRRPRLIWMYNIRLDTVGIWNMRWR